MQDLTDDAKARRLALDPTQSFIIQAPAGSGKTELLIQRFLTLLIHVKRPEEILAITFTKKAANEMRNRVLSALQSAEKPEPTSPHAQLTWQLAQRVLQRDQQFNWHLLENPNQLRIQTIDSLCSFLTKQLPLLSHFGASPDITDQPYPLYKCAVDEILRHLEENYEWSHAIGELLIHLDNNLNKLQQLIISLLAKRDQWLPYIHLDLQDMQIKQELEQHLQAVITAHLRHLHAQFPQTQVEEILQLLNFATSNLSDRKSPLLACQALADLPGTQTHDQAAWLGIAHFLLTKSFDWRKRLDSTIGFPALASFKNPQEKATHQDFRRRTLALLTMLSEQENLRVALEDLSFLPQQHYDAAQWRVLKALLHVLKIAIGQLRLVFQQQGQIDYIENAQAALFALGNEEHPTNLALALDYQIRHILVDEFQDTSLGQAQLLEKLTMGFEVADGRTVFVVGDPMQSIYRFREAEVGLFIRMFQQGMRHLHLNPLKLTSNFRSAAEIVDWNNQHFQAIFPIEDDIATGAVKYSPSATTKTPTNHNQIKITGVADTQAQAQQIVALIKELSPTMTDIAILVRSRSHLATIVPALKQAHIPYQAVEIDALATRPFIQDLLSLTCALLNPADRIAWLSVLRAPWCGLTLNDLHVIANKDGYATIYELIKAPMEIACSPDARLRLSRVQQILARQLAERDRQPLRNWVESTWLLLGGPASLNEANELVDVQAFFELLTVLSSKNLQINLESLQDKVNQLFASTHHPDAKVQIMTIHAAKGLEFDTVIVPHLERKLPPDDKPLLAWMEQPLMNEQTALLLAPIQAVGNNKHATYEYILRRQKIKTAHEVNRLLYVATTRAKQNLYLFYVLERTADVKIPTSSFLEKLWGFLPHKSQETESIEQTDSPTEKTTTHYLKRFTTNWHNIVTDASANASGLHQQRSGFKLYDPVPQLYGSLLHRLLQQFAELGTNWWLHHSYAERNDFLSYLCRQIGLTPTAALLLQTQTTITTMLQDKRGQWILHSHTEAKSEYAISAKINDKVERFVFDRTFVENDTRWIIDYKFAALTQTDVATFLQTQQTIYQNKMKKYQQALQPLENRPIRLGLYFPALPAWQEIL